MRRLARRLQPLPLRRVCLLLAAAAVASCGRGISLDEPIEGPLWRLVQLGEQPVAASPDPQRDPQLQFDAASGRVSGPGGCNRLSGTFQRSGSTLRMSQLAATRMACTDPARSAAETQFFEALQLTAAYRLLQGPPRLVLLNAGGRTLATLSAGAR